MFFDELSQLKNIIKNVQTVILCLEDGTPVGNETFDLATFSKELTAITIAPEEGKIKIDQTRAISEVCAVKQCTDRYFIVSQAETMTTQAANSLLKLLEEPLNNYHFILLSTAPGAILKTIRSRASIYAPRVQKPLEQAVRSSKEVQEMARRIIAAKSTDICAIAEEINKKKPDIRRSFAMDTLATAIEICYKSYFKTKRAEYVAKIPNYIAAYKGVSANGNLKLQIIANLI